MQYIFDASEHILHALSGKMNNDEMIDADEISIVADEEDKHETSMQLLLHEKENEALDYNAYARQRIIKLKEDLQVLTAASRAKSDRDGLSRQGTGRHTLRRTALWIVRRCKNS